MVLFDVVPRMDPRSRTVAARLIVRFVAPMAWGRIRQRASWPDVLLDLLFGRVAACQATMLHSDMRGRVAIAAPRKEGRRVDKKENFDSSQSNDEIFVEIVEDETEILFHHFIGVQRY